MDNNIFIINIPLNIKIVYWLNKKSDKNVNIFLFDNSKNLKLNVKIEKSGINHDLYSNSIILEKKIIFNHKNKVSSNLYNLLKSWNSYFFIKIKFKGKGFRIRFLKKLKLVKFFFGRSHKTFMLFKFVMVKRINKYKFIIKGLKKEKLIENSKKITNIKPINFYTLRGLRKSRQIIFKRKGKKGTYI